MQNSFDGTWLLSESFDDAGASLGPLSAEGTMNAAQWLVRCLEHEGVDVLFGVPGEENLDVLDALADSRIRLVVTRHEQSAAFMADVHGRLTGRAGVCLSTLGPGATNLLTGIADANLDRAPLVAITGQAGLDRMHKESHQAIDIRSMFRPVTKWNAELVRPSVISEAVRKAFALAQAEKPGAAHLELPEDVAQEPVSEDDRTLFPIHPPASPEPSHRSVMAARELIGQARRPILLAGNGVVRRRAAAAVRRFARRGCIPVVHTFMAKGVMPDHDPLSLFTIGLQGGDYVNEIMRDADLVIAAGYDFAEYAPRYWHPLKDKTIVHIDSGAAEIDASYAPAVSVVGDPTLSLDRIGQTLGQVDGRWAAKSRRQLSAALSAEYEAPRGWPLRPQHIIDDLRAALAPEDLVICDVGAHKLWMARMFPCERENTCIISNGFAAMGIGLPGAIAAKLLFPARRVVAVTGDGGFLMNAGELETASRLGLALVVLVWRDDGYGVIRWKQQMRFGRTAGVELGNPDLVAHARSFGADGVHITHPTDLLPALREGLRSTRTWVIDCPVDYAENTRLARR